MQCDMDNDESQEEEVCSQYFDENDSFPVLPFYNISPRPIPESPHKIIEETFKSNPWIMLVATIFLTKTTARQCRPLMKKFFTDFPTPHDLLQVSPSSLEVYFETLGMKKRANMIWKMTYQFVSGKWNRASDLCGIGKYGEDAYRMFILAHTNVEPEDRFLKLYLDWLKTQTDHLEWLGEVDSENYSVDPVSQNYSIALK